MLDSREMLPDDKDFPEIFLLPFQLLSLMSSRSAPEGFVSNAICVDFGLQSGYIRAILKIEENVLTFCQTHKHRLASRVKIFHPHNFSNAFLFSLEMTPGPKSENASDHRNYDLK